ncbi:MAG: aspartate--tRNA ligase [Gammaproteobacteria bacterium RIFCSPHIGHO2_02_FULL_42_13]|nr:MAG: aspartate--tRNA ligase [Gammaproteobacteria bacterium RIFCSPHIGHO2_02_FULL_42_13]OGT68104.1 MAG: aspartate--tRNA ligase [Gammaproteobacteria bacterium RIFCSPLOWO2_02_FULL_42_9]HLB58211.1 aspartate--tRNA ligase [Gammaproteobacteria bacterium]
MRSHYCGEVNERLVGKTITLCGWVHRARNLGGMIFLDLRDREGIVQVVVHPEQKEIFKLAQTIRNEYVLCVTGKVNARPGDMINTKMKTGTIEVEAAEIKILNTAEPPPFVLDNYVPVSEDVRLKYRYIDLRRPEVFYRIQFRSKLVRAMHNFLDDHGFLEIETPHLTRATPEGARDYLVPSRVQPGHFYALPQSPQLFKQLLMMGGVDRYYQLAKCFRDEDLRADRQPEFTQLDIEMSFIKEEDVMQLMETMMQRLFKDLLEVTLPAFPRMTYAEAMQKYGSDKPDLRISLELVDVADLLKTVEFKVFSSVANDPAGRIAALRVPKGATFSRKNIDDYETLVKKFGAKGLAWMKVNDLNDVQSPIKKFLSDEIVHAILRRVGAQKEDIIFFVADNYRVTSESLGALRVHVGEKDASAWKPLWVTDFPMFEKVDGHWHSLHHPFTAPQDMNNLAHGLSHAYDMVLNGSELGGGSIRIDNIETQQAVFNLLNISEKEAREKFGFLLEALKYGCPPHGGIAFGLDRIAMMMAGASSIRDVIAFPKTATASCLLTNAPSTVSDEQLKELHVQVNTKE